MPVPKELLDEKVTFMRDTGTVGAGNLAGK